MTITDRSGYRRIVLAMLLVVYTFNWIDRQILAILAKPIQADLGLSDAAFGAIGGTAFALVYAGLGVPLALAADRFGKARVIAASLIVWSGFTALSGLARGVGGLAGCRLGVGVGEAGGVAPSYALIADHFFPERRARALAVYAMGIPIGLAFGTLFGAYVAALVDWRAAFIGVGVAGIAVAPVFLAIVRDAPATAPASVADRSPLAVLPLLAAKPAYWLLSLGAAASSLAGYGLALWTPKIVAIQFGWTDPTGMISVGRFMASLLLIGGAGGIYLGGALADRLGRGDRAWYALLPMIAWLVTVPTYAAGLLTASPIAAWPLLLIPNALALLWLGPVVTAVQHLAPPSMRAGASGAFLLIVNLIGLGVGPWLVGRLSDALKATHGAASLRDAALACLGFYLVAAALVALAARSLRRDWVEEAAPSSPAAAGAM